MTTLQMYDPFADTGFDELKYDNGVLALMLAKKPAVTGRKLAVQ
jgi:hypothetical protein